MSVNGPRAIVLPCQSVASLSTVHDSVIGLSPAFPRFHFMGVPSVTESSRVVSYQRRCVESPAIFPRSVASASVSKRAVAYRVACVPLRGVASASRLSPRVALAPALQSLRRAALAKKCARIVGRLACLAAGQPRQQLQ